MSVEIPDRVSRHWLQSLTYDDLLLVEEHLYQNGPCDQWSKAFQELKKRR